MFGLREGWPAIIVPLSDISHASWLGRAFPQPEPLRTAAGPAGGETSGHLPLDREEAMKLRLRLDDLRVDAFATGEAGVEARGTVRARESFPVWTVQNCPPQTADDTCGMTCGHTCEPPSCNPDTVCGCA